MKFTAALAFIATYAFFYEYLPPFKSVHIYSFQAIQVAPGEHTIGFEYHQRYLLLGAVVSFAAILELIAAIHLGRSARYQSKGDDSGPRDTL
jgi:hypothetical protein